MYFHTTGIFVRIVSFHRENCIIGSFREDAFFD